MKNRLYVIIAFLLVTSLVSASEEISNPQIDSLYLRASLYDYEGNFQEAADIYENILQITDSEFVYGKLAEDYARLNDVQSMKLTLERGLRKNPDSVILTGLLADLYRFNKDTLQKSYEMYNKAYEMSKDTSYLFGLALAYTSAEDYNNAINVYDRLVALDKRSEYYLNRGRVYEKLGLEKESVEDFKAAVELDSNFSAASRLADYYLKKDDAENSIKYLKIMLQDNPDNILAKFRMAEVLKRVGNNDDAYKFYEALTSSLTGNELAYVLKQLATMSYAKHDYEKAYGYFVRAYELDSDTRNAYSAAILAEGMKDNEKAKGWYLKILELTPDFADARKRLAIIYLKQEKPDDAIKTLSGLDSTYMDVEYYRITAEAYSMKQDYANAEKVLKEALLVNERDSKLRLDLAVLYDEINKRDLAVALVKEGLKLEPDNESYLNFVGYTYADMGINLKEAKSMIKKALEKRPQEPAYLDSMGWVLYKLGRYKDAYDYQKKALKLAPDVAELQDHMKSIMQKLGIRKSIDDVIKED
ncbi:MAG: tetratricopeptide repeat protein [Deferribacterales bacterium]